MKKILIATHNYAKLEEMTVLFSSLQFHILSLADVGITDEVEEDGKTFAENSVKKAVFYSQKSGLPAIADDGGLEISALNGQPGVHSKRWLGPKTTEAQLIEHMKKISKLLPKDNRDAAFRTVLTFALPNGKHFSQEGKVRGIIPEHYVNDYKSGFPFRSFFYLPKLGKFFLESELVENEQKEYNHRYKAAQKLIPIIKRELQV